MPTAAILSQGDEVVTGQIADTNAAWLSERLTELGFQLVQHLAVGDRLADIVRAFQSSIEVADLVVCTGGLGPTDDDLTTQAVAAAFDRPLEFDEIAMQQIEALFARFQRHMPDINRRQAWLPRGTTRLDNSWGTAPGFAFHQGSSLLACFPGVPREMKPMFSERLVPLLRAQFPIQPGHLVTLRTVGISESEIQARVGRFEHPKAVFGTRTVLPENQVKLRVTADSSAEERHAVATSVADKLGSSVFAIEGLGDAGGTLTEVIARLLLAQGETLSVAESCTGGRVATECTSLPGSSRWFLEGVVSYSNDSKQRVLGVSEATIQSFGAVSEPVAREMAEGLRSRSGSTYSLATTGIAGPEGGSDEKPVGTVHIALATPSGTHHRRVSLGGDRHRIQALAVGTALDLLRRCLQHSL